MIPPADPLAALYADLPTVACLGRCWPSCGPIAMSEREAVRMARAVGERATRPFSPDTGCGYLSDAHRCLVYVHRPLICRLYGVAEGLLCEYGCRPSRVMPRAEVAEWFARVSALSRGVVVETAPGLLDVLGSITRP